MNLPALDIPAILRQYDLNLKKSLGQNFLSQPAVLEKIVAAADLPMDSEVLEVGPGLGTLTRHLSRRVRRVVAVEIDQRLIPILQSILAGLDNVRIIHDDILNANIAEIMEAGGYRVVANIPYYITSALLKHLLEAEKKPAKMVLTVQKEVAERICAEEGNMSLLALSVQVYGSPKKVLTIPAGAFYPPPSIDSTVVAIDLYPQPVIPTPNLDMFFLLAKAGFSQKRKTLRNSLSAGMRLKPNAAETLLKQAEIDPQRRAETLALAEWRVLTSVYLEMNKGSDLS